MSEVLKSLVRGVVKNAQDTRAIRASKEVLRRLEQGRPDSITDMLLEDADQAFLTQNYDLPMDFDSRVRRAIDLGFDPQVFYRGTNKQMYAQGKPQFTSDNPYLASTYAKHGDDNTPVLTPVLTRPGRTMDVNADGNMYFDIRTAEAEKYFPDFLELIGKKPEDIQQIDNAGAIYPQLATDDFETLLRVTKINARDAGNKVPYDSVTFHDVRDAGPWTLYKDHESGSFRVDTDAMEAATSPSTVRIVEPEDMRSIFARFDPRLPRNIKHLSAGVAAAPALPYIVQQYLDEVSNGGS